MDAPSNPSSSSSWDEVLSQLEDVIQFVQKKMNHPEAFHNSMPDGLEEQVVAFEKNVEVFQRAADDWLAAQKVDLGRAQQIANAPPPDMPLVLKQRLKQTAILKTQAEAVRSSVHKNSVKQSKKRKPTRPIQARKNKFRFMDGRG